MDNFLSSLLVLLVCVSSYGESIVTKFQLNNRPIIGVLSQEYYTTPPSSGPENVTKSYIAASYVKYLEGAGAQVVPIMIGQDKTYLATIFSKINGLLLPGGGIYFPETEGTNGFVDAAHYLIKLAKEANNKGDYFPVWGTCLGFEFMIYDEVKSKQIMAKCFSSNITNRLKFTKDAIGSNIYGNAPKNILKILAFQEVTVNFHSNCLTPENYTKFGVDKSYKSTTLNYDSKANLTYISSVEHRKYPFYGVQFHPEKNIYEWTTKKNIPHTSDAIKIAQYFGNFFVDEARKSSHHFASVDEENAYLIYNYYPKFTGKNGSTFQQIYVFNISKKLN